MNEAGPWGKGAREGTGGWGGQEAGESPGGHGSIRAVEGVEKGCKGQEARRRVLNFRVEAGSREVVSRLADTININLG